MNVSFEVTDKVDDAAKERILGSLLEYNARKTGISSHSPLLVRLNDADGTLVGGLIGRTALGWLHVELLFVPEAFRGRGIGTELMQRAEAEAVRRGCHSAWLDTFQFQAREFYERLDYESFGELGGYPIGFSRYFMRKVLSPDTASR